MKRTLKAASMILGALLLALGLVWGGVSAATATPPQSTTTVLWVVNEDAEGIWPQQYVTSVTGSNLAAFDSQMECGHTYQVDIYNNSEITDALIAGGVLYGPGNPQEDLVAGGDGVAYKVVYKDDCPPPFEPQPQFRDRTNGPIEPTCETPVVTWDTWQETRSSKEDGTFTEWVEVEGSRVTHEDELSIEEDLACNPVTEPPTTEPPVTEPPTTPTPSDPPTTDTPTQPTEPPTPTDPPTTVVPVPDEPTTPPDMTTQRTTVPTLAETGPETGPLVAAGILLLLGSAILVLLRKRERGNL